MVDRLTCRAHIINIKGDSYRMRETKEWLNFVLTNAPPLFPLAIFISACITNLEMSSYFTFTSGTLILS